MRIRISTKLTLLCTVLVLITGGILYYFAETEAEKAVEQQIRAHFSAKVLHATDNIDRFLYERLSDVQSIAQDPVLTAAFDSAAVHRRLSEIKAQNAMYSSISYFDANRVRLADTEGLSIGKVHSLSKYWLPISEGAASAIDVSFSESLQRPVLHFAVAVLEPDGGLKGLLVSRVVIERLYEVFENDVQLGFAGDSVQIDLLDSQGMVLYSSHRPQDVLQQTNPYFAHIRAKIAQKQAHSAENDTLFFYAQEKGFMSYGGNGWTVLIRLAEKMAYAPVYALRYKMLVVSAAILVAAILFALITSRRIYTPILDLTRAAEAFGRGEMNVQFEVRTHDEIRVLGDRFREMAENIHQRMKNQESLNEQLKSVVSQLDKRNKDMTSGINYAQRIQKALLPKVETLAHHFPEYFILYRPKDIVGGDFYWFDVVQHEGHTHVLLAVADCTGHGVPGGFMSVLGSNLLNSIAIFGKNFHPGTVLEKLNRAIKKELHQEENKEASKDGMEVAFCNLCTDTLSLQFCGGGRPLLWLHDGHLIECKGDQVTIGGVSEYYQKHGLTYQATTHDMTLHRGDIIYLFTDGFKDQMGQDGDGQIRKFSNRRFRDLIQQHAHLPLAEQKKYLDEALDGWQGGQKQTDDILVLAVRV